MKRKKTKVIYIQFTNTLLMTFLLLLYTLRISWSIGSICCDRHHHLSHLVIRTYIILYSNVHILYTYIHINIYIAAVRCRTMMFNAKHLTSSLSQQRSKALIITLQYKTLRKVRQKNEHEKFKGHMNIFFMAKNGK